MGPGTSPVEMPDSLSLVLAHATTRPGQLALKDDDESLTYGELYERTATIASGLSALGVGPGDRVALWLPNSVGFVTVALGCLWIGASFIPLSVDDPPARSTRILADSDPRLVVAPGADHVGSGPPSRSVVDIDTILGRRGPIPERSRDPERDVYVIYTSGTTGTPKGVRIPERAFSWSVMAITKLLGLDPTTRSLCGSAFHFDGSYGTLFPTLAAGGAAVIPRREELRFVKRFYSAVLSEGITHTGCSPSYLRLVLSSPRLGSLKESNLKTLGLGGEECIARDLQRLWEVIPALRIFNRYGPSETAIEVTTHEIDPSQVQSGRVPIGIPHPGVSFYLIGEDRRLVAHPGEVGELYIGGHQLMKGYLGDEELSATVLRQDIVPGQTIYRTGDLVSLDDRGRYVYRGRSDDIVKRRGVRISLDEVTQVLRGVDAVSSVVCIPIDLEGRLAIAAFVEAGPDVTAPGLLQTASSQLPATMLPDEVFVVDALPLNPSGKLDRAALLTAAGRQSWRPY